MGLLMNVFEFPSQLPSIERIEHGAKKLADVRLVREGTLDASPSDEIQRRHQSKSDRSISLRESHSRLRRLGQAKRYVDLVVSLDGTKILVSGNDVKLFYAIEECLKNLGGEELKRRPKKLRRSTSL